MNMRSFVRDELREKHYQNNPTSGLPLFDQRSIEDKSLQEATMPAHKKTLESSVPVQREALDAVADKLNDQNLRVLTIFRDGNEYCAYDIQVKTGYPVNVVSRVINTLRVKLALLIISDQREGPMGVRVNYYRLNEDGIADIEAAHPGGRS